MASSSFNVDYINVSSVHHAIVRLRAADHAPDLSQSSSVIITYSHEERRVTVKTVTSETETPHVGDGEGRFVRSLCSRLPPEKSTGFSNNNVGLLASVINAAAEVLAFSGFSLPAPISVDAYFRSASTHQTLLKVIIADTAIFGPHIKKSIVSKTELSLYESDKVSSGTLICFMKMKMQAVDEGFSTMLARNTGDEFRIPESLARKVRMLYSKTNQSRFISISNIPKPLLFLLRYNFETDLEYKTEFLRDLMLSPTVFVLRVLEWLPYFWVEDIASWGCKILSYKFSYELGHPSGLQNVAASLHML